MKLLALSVIAASTFSFLNFGDQDIPQNEVPSVVLNAFTQAHPNAAQVEWEKQHDMFEAEFENDSIDYTVQLSAAGEVLQTKHDVTETELPQQIRKMIAESYAKYKIDDVELVEKKGTLYYQVELDGTLQDKHLVLDATGKEQKTVSYWD